MSLEALMIILKKLKQIAPVVLVVLCAGCAVTRATDPDSFKSLAKVQIPPSQILQFSDCVMDRFQLAHTFGQANVRQQRRAGGYRIESYAGTGSTRVLVSVDIMDDGRAELLESDAAALINTRGEREGFEYCAAQLTRVRK